MKKMLSAILIITLIATACVFAVGCATQTPEGDTAKTPNGTATATSYVVLDINPTVEMTLSEEEIVVTVTAANDDAEVLLNRVAVEGKTLEEASELLADASVGLGFISEGENSEISITVVGDTAEIEENIFGKIRDKFCAFVQEKCHFNLGVEKDVLLSLEAELKELKAANPENEAIQALNIARYRMIVSAMEKDSTLTLETALTMQTRDLIRIIRDGAMKQIGKKFESLEIEAEYEMEKIKDKVYADMGVLTQLESIRLASLRALEFEVEVLEECNLKEHKTIILDEENIKKVAEILGLTAEETPAFIEKCMGLDGTYSVHNMKFAINRIYRNLPKTEREAFEDNYDRVEDYIEGLEVNIEVPTELVKLLAASVEAYNRLAPVNQVTMPETFANIAALDAFLEIFEEAIEEEIEVVEEKLEDKIEAAGREAEFEAKMDAIEAQLDAIEDAMEKDHDRLKGEHEEELREHINGWMNRHNGNGQGGTHTKP